MAPPLSFMRVGRGSGVAIVLSGIQSTAYGQALGLLPALTERYKYVVGYDYDNLSWHDPEQLSAELMEAVAYWQRNEGRVVLIGLSLGAFVAVSITSLLGVKYGRARVENHEAYRVILIDPPFGADTMRAIPGWMAPVAHFLFAVLGAVTPASMKMEKSERPTEEQLWKPNRGSMAVMFPEHDPVSYLERARAADMNNQVGHSWRVWFQQLAFLTGGALELPFHDMAGVKADLITAESSRNTVVRTKVATSRWCQRVAFGHTQNVHAEHAATLRHQPYYELALRQLLNN